MENLFDKIMDNEELTEDEVKIIEKLKNEDISEEEYELYREFMEQDDLIIDFNPKYFKNINEKNKVLAKIRFKELYE
jgi:hypothetical protein